MQLFPSFASEPDPHLLNLGLDASAVNLTGSDLAGLIIYTDFGLVLKQSIRCSNMKRERERERESKWLLEWQFSKNGAITDQRNLREIVVLFDFHSLIKCLK